MSTLVQIKRSTTNTAPPSLIEGELAYSYVSNTLFIGTTANTVLNIGGKYYTDLLDNGSAANSSMTFVRRYSNGSAQFSQLDILVAPTSNSHVATKEYVDTAVLDNVTLASLNDVNIGTAFSDQNNKILIGNSAGYYVGTAVTGNVSISNTGVITIGAGQVVNSMLANAQIGVVAGAGLASNLAVPALGETIQLDIIAGDGISNTGDHINVNTTVVRTDRNQTLNGFMSFSNTVTINADLSVTGNINLTGNTTYVNVATLNVTDPLIFVAANNITSDIVDIGLFGTYNDGANVEHTGLVRHASDKIWYLFEHEIADPSNNIVDVANSTYALLRANIDAQSMNTQTLGISQTLFVTGNTTLSSNLTVSKNVSVTQNLSVTGTGSFGSLTLGAALPVGSGGTGLTSFTANGVFFADTTSSLSFASGTEGQVLQIASGVPAFAMLDGGSF